MICIYWLRVARITEYSRHGKGLEVADRVSGRESTRRTLPYSRLREKISRDEIERTRL